MTPRVADLAERLEQRLDDGRREPERRLVEQQHVGPREQRAGDRELLLLAARERPGLALRELGDDREEAVHPVEVVGDAVLAPPPGEPEAQVLVDGQRAEDVAALGHERDAGAGDVLRARRAAALPCSRISPPASGTARITASSVVDLPAPFGPIRPTISPRSSRRLRPRTAGTAP